MQVSHVLPEAWMSSAFAVDEPNPIAHAGLIPALALALANRPTSSTS